MLPDASYRHEYDRLRQITKIRISIIEFTIFFLLGSTCSYGTEMSTDNWSLYKTIFVNQS